MDVDPSIRRGFLWGMVATLAMTTVMIIATALQLSPMPSPIPVALAGAVLGGGLPKPALLTMGMVAHFAYGGAAGALLTRWGRVTWGRALLFAVALWLIMQVVFLPYLGWGVFGSALTPRIAVATLVLHLVYGGVIAFCLTRWGAVRALGEPAGVPGDERTV